jgi:hypothetical protein
MESDREKILAEIMRLREDAIGRHASDLNDLIRFIDALPTAEEVQMWCGAIDGKCRRELFPSKDDAIKCGYEENEVELVAIRKMEGQA